MNFFKTVFTSLLADSTRPSLLPYTLPSSGDSATVSDGFVGVAIGSRPLVRVLIPVLQPMREDGIGVSAVSVRWGVDLRDLVGFGVLIRGGTILFRISRLTVRRDCDD